MDTLDSSQSDEIISAVKGVISDVNNNSHPNDAFIKVVKSGKFSPEIVHRMVEAFNQSKAVKQLDEDPEKRAAHFDLADPAVIFNSVYSAVDTDTSEGSYIYDDTESHNFLAKKAHVDILVYQAAEPYALSETTLANHALAKQAALQSDLRKVEAEEISNNMKAWDMLQKAASSFRYANHESFSDFERRTQRAFGEKGKSLVEMVYKIANVNRTIGTFEKQATYLIPARTPYLEITEAIQSCEKAATAMNSRMILEVAVEGHRRDMEKGAFELSMDDLLKKISPENNEGKPGKLYPKDMGYEADLKSIDIKANVADLMANDPVIGSYPLNQVLDATNAAVSLAPTAMMNKATLRAALQRTLVDHNMSVDEALQYAENEAGLNDVTHSNIAKKQMILG